MRLHCQRGREAKIRRLAAKAIADPRKSPKTARNIPNPGRRQQKTLDLPIGAEG
jgi:hypothetical protein